MRERAVAGALNAGGTLVVTLLSIARTKVFAVLVGVSGIGVLSQVLAVQSAVLSVTPLFSGPPLLAALAVAARAGHDRHANMLASARGLALLAVGVPAAVVILVSLAQGGDLGTLLAIGALGVPFGALLAVEQTALQGAQRFMRLALTNVIGAAAGLAIVAALTLQRGIDGATVGITIAMVIGWVVTYAATPERTPLIVFDRARWLSIARIGTGALLASVVAVVGVAAVRPIAFVTVGAVGAGVVYALMGLSLQLSLLVATALTTYAAPRIAAAAASGNMDRIRDELTTIQLLGLMGSSVGFIALAAVAGPVVTLLLSDAFAPVAVLLPVQLAGELFLIHSWLTGTYLVPLGHRRMLVAIPATIAVMRTSLPFVLVPLFGVAAFPIAHLLAAATAALLMASHARRSILLAPRLPLLIASLGAIGTLFVPVAPVISVAAIAGLVALTARSSLLRRFSLVRRSWNRRA